MTPSEKATATAALTFAAAKISNALMALNQERDAFDGLKKELIKSGDWNEVCRACRFDPNLQAVDINESWR